MEMMSRCVSARRWLLLGLCLGTASTACANDFMFSVAATPVVGLTFLAWIIVGLVVKLACRDLMYFGVAGVSAAAFFTFFGHPEAMFSIWMIYLGLLVAYFAFRRTNLPPNAVRVNLIFHGIFLAVVVVGGIICKIAYWSRKGSYADWSEFMRETFPGFLIVTAFFALVVVLAIREGAARMRKRFEVASDDKK